MPLHSEQAFDLAEISLYNVKAIRRKIHEAAFLRTGTKSLKSGEKL